MPFYEYECANCKFYTEVLQKISEPPLKKCPSCGKQALKKLISAPVFRLKGSGWYETDFKSENEQKRNLVADDQPPPADKAGAKSESGAAESKADAKGETKVDAKADTKSEGKSNAKPADAGAGKTGSATSSARKGARSTPKPVRKAGVPARTAAKRVTAKAGTKARRR